LRGASRQTPGAEKSIALDALQRPAGMHIKNGSGNQTLASRQYQYDTLDNITRIKSDLGQSDYQYDTLQRPIFQRCNTRRRMSVTSRPLLRRCAASAGVSWRILAAAPLP